MQRILMCAVLLFTVTLAVQAEERSISRDAAGTPTFIVGDLGQLPEAADLATGGAAADKSSAFETAAMTFLNGLVADRFGAVGGETFRTHRVRTDELGTSHARFNQYLHGRRVVGAELTVHTDSDGIVYAVSGHFAPAAAVPRPADARLRRADIAQRAGSRALAGKLLEEPRKVYFYDGESGRTFLTWEARMRGMEAGEPFENLVYVDALTGSVVGVAPQIHSAKSWRSYDANNQPFNSSSLPGTLRCTNSQSCGGDAAVQRAHDGAGTVYDYYQSRFGRDSINGSGMTMISSAHVGSSWNNAVWFNNQMMYGEGDGSTFRDLTFSFDVIGHELTHGVTQFESNMIYARESGALNEAWSDIFGAASDTFRRGGTVDANTWKIGEDVYTPGTSGDALRYMDNPTADNYSKDYYPERLYPGSCSPSNGNDQCGVHGNSGIANLAFKLLVTGGTHPRGKTTASVPSIGMSKAEQIFYRAQTTYLSSSSNFSAARTATAQAAQDLYGATDKTAVETAWCAVGVGSCPTGPGNCHSGAPGSANYCSTSCPCDNGFGDCDSNAECVSGTTCVDNVGPSYGWASWVDVCEGGGAPDPNSCVGNCGGQAPGGCWCDDQCAGFGDCCSDRAAVCG